MDTVRAVLCAVLAMAFVLGVGCSPDGDGEPAEVQQAGAGERQANTDSQGMSGDPGPLGHRVSGPYRHDNLAIFLIHGKETMPGRTFLTLDEALEKKVLVVHETGNVNELRLENRSATESIYIQGGEMVSGGKQDRVLGVDFVVAPKSRDVKIPSYCVEQSRWSGRVEQSSRAFDSKNNYVRNMTRSNKPGVGNVPASQSGVWDKVKKMQQAEIGNVPEMILSKYRTSLDVTHENPKLKAAVKKYTDALAPILEGKDDVVGFACALNGKIDGADTYGSTALLRKLWPKLLEASAIDAIVRLEKDKTFDPPPVEDVTKWLAEKRDAKALKRTASERISARMMLEIRETESGVLLEALDEGSDEVIHSNYQKK